jgi:hypothetical protein
MSTPASTEFNVVQHNAIAAPATAMMIFLFMSMCVDYAFVLAPQFYGNSPFDMSCVADRRVNDFRMKRRVAV